LALTPQWNLGGSKIVIDSNPITSIHIESNNFSIIGVVSCFTIHDNLCKLNVMCGIETNVCKSSIHCKEWETSIGSSSRKSLVTIQ